MKNRILKALVALMLIFSMLLPEAAVLARECDTGVIELFNESWLDDAIKAVEACPKRIVE